MHFDFGAAFMVAILMSWMFSAFYVCVTNPYASSAEAKTAWAWGATNAIASILFSGFFAH